MDFHRRTKVFINAVNDNQWDIVAQHLTVLLENASHEQISLICAEENCTRTFWLNMLLKSKLYKDNDKGELLTRSIILKTWKDATFDNRWNLLISLLVLYDIRVCVSYDVEDVMKYLIRIHEKTGISLAFISSLSEALLPAV